jgi:murein DD-endopeptidase MepM/ murein hydrolase activator NlpD
MQVASEVTSVGSKIQDGGDVDIETAGQYNKSLDNPETGSSWSNASSIQYENGQNPSKTTFSDYPELIPNKEGAVTAVDDFFKSVDKYAGLGQSIDVVCGAFSFFDGISSAIIGSVPLLGTYINDLSAKGYSALIVVLAGETVDYTNPVYAGAVYGEAANVGARLMANESSASAGGRPLSTVEALRLKSETNAYIAATEDRNIAQKILDFNDPKNPLGKVASSLQQKDVIGSMKSLLNTDIFMPKLSAEGQAITDKEVYYGVPKFGFDPAKLDSELVENPYENAEWVAQNLTLDSQAVKDFEECTNVRVTSDWNFESLSYPEGILTNFADMPEKCKNDGDEALYRLRVLALDTITMKSYSCVTFDDSQACAEIYPENVSNSTTDPVSNQAPNKDGWVWPLAKNLKQGPCWNVLTSSGYHAGMDINTDDVSENNPAIAAHDGKVIATGSDGAAGNYITIKSTDGVYYSYQHLTGFKVRTGDNVTAGQPVGLVGKTGNVRASSAGHLHFVTSREDTLGSYSSSPQKNTFDPLSVLPTEAPNGYECIK